MDARSKNNLKAKVKRFCRRVLLSPLAVFMGNGMTGMGDILNPPTLDRESETDHEEADRGESEAKGEGEDGADQQETGEKETQVAAETKEEKQEEAKPTATAEAVRAELAALTKERERLRAKEAALDAEREKLKQPVQEEEKPDFWDNPEAQLTALEQRMEQKLLNERLNISETYARGKYTDFQEKLDVFAGMIQEAPELHQRMLRDPNPAEFAYKAAADKLKVAKLQELGDPDEYRAKVRGELRDEIKAEILAELKKEEAEKVEAAIREKLGKGGFSEQRSVGSERTTTKTFNGPTPMGKILG